MGVATVHPSQRRVSCEVCRKHKSRCQRLNRNDPKCARCILLDVECTTGQQKIVGRPRRAVAPTSSPSSTIMKPAASSYRQTTPPRTPQENNVPNRAFQIPWTRLMSPSSDLVQFFDTVESPCGGAVATWPTLGMGSFDRCSPPLDAGFSLANTDFTFEDVSAFGMPTLSPYTPPFSLPQSPPSAVPRDYGTCLTTNTFGIPGPETAKSIDDATALMELSKMNRDLHIRVAAAEMNIASLDFCDVIYREGALYINNFTLAEFMLSTSQVLLQLLNRLLSTRQPRDQLYVLPPADASSLKSLSMQSQSQRIGKINTSSCGPPSYPTDITRLLPAPVALVITSIFTQLISLYELILELITACVERIEPIAPIPCFTYDGLPMDNSDTQGMLCSEAIVYLLEKLEGALGIKSGPSATQTGLLSARQVKVLWSELDSRRAIIPGHDIMRPPTLRRLFRKVAIILRGRRDLRGNK